MSKLGAFSHSRSPTLVHPFRAEALYLVQPPARLFQGGTCAIQQTAKNEERLKTKKAPDRNGILATVDPAGEVQWPGTQSDPVASLWSR
jgi:hypothetical protein